MVNVILIEKESFTIHSSRYEFIDSNDVERFIGEIIYTFIWAKIY